MSHSRSFASTFRTTLPPLAVALLLPAAGLGQAEDPRGFQVASGRVTFRTYCASCHGVDGRGDGHVAQYLNVQPSDLTAITQRHDGAFPVDRITAIIDGREPVRGHGSGEMPVWGDIFQSPMAAGSGSGEDGEQRADRKILELVRFLESIQDAFEPPTDR